MCPNAAAPVPKTDFPESRKENSGTNTEQNKLGHFDIACARKAYAEGKNVTEVLRQQRGVSFNTPEIIEAAYDLQAGTYIDFVRKNVGQATFYASELASILDKHIAGDKSLLDVGTGELTTLSLVVQRLAIKPRRVFAFDVSWSRVYKGLEYAKEEMRAEFERLTPFVADIGEIPLKDKSVDITTSSHALEPNGDKLEALLSELFRVTREKLVLFEPSYELNSEEGKRRMERLGYIREIEGTVTKLGGKLLERIPIKNVNNPLNPTACYVVSPPPLPQQQQRQPHPSQLQKDEKSDSASAIFSVPGTGLLLTERDGFFTSEATGQCYPVLKGIPILRSNTAILASCFSG